jgi:hypothetical protein
MNSRSSRPSRVCTRVRRNAVGVVHRDGLVHGRFLYERHTWSELRVGEDALAFQAREQELLVGLADQQLAAWPKRAGVTGRTAQVWANGFA